MAEREQVPIPSPGLLRDLQEIVRWWRAHGKRVPGVSSDPHKDSLFTPETHIALTPTGGIPGLSVETGTGSPQSLNSAECRVWRVESSGILTPVGTRQQVFNVTDQTVAGGSYVVVTRLKERIWVVVTESNAKVYIAVAPDGGLPGLRNLCETGTGTGTGTGPIGLVSPINCAVYAINGFRIERIEGRTRDVSNLGLDDIPECAIFPIWQESGGHWVTIQAQFEEEDEPDTSERVLHCVNTRLVTATEEGEITAESPCDCCDVGSCVQTGTGSGGAWCDSSLTPNSCCAGRYGPAAYDCGMTATLNATFPWGVDEACLSEIHDEFVGQAMGCGNVEPYDCGDYYGERWVISTWAGVLTVTGCNCLWTLDASWNALAQTTWMFNGAQTHVVTTTQGAPCDAPSFEVNTSEVTGRADVEITMSFGSCAPEWRCWLNNSTLESFCSTADESATSTLQSGPYQSEALCEAGCVQPWLCWSEDGSETPGGFSHTYRYCSDTNDDATATLISGPYLTEGECNAVCEVWFCIEFLWCDDDACSVNCEPAPTQFSCGPAVNTSCQALTPGPSDPQKFSAQATVIAQHSSEEECQTNCV